jgi:hypothetical protein
MTLRAERSEMGLDQRSDGPNKPTPILFSATIRFIALAHKVPNFVLVCVDDSGWAQLSVEMIKGPFGHQERLTQTTNENYI